LRINSKAIALSSLNYGDNSLISKVYSKEFGYINLISSLRKNKKQNFKPYFDPLNCIQISISYRANKDLHRLTEVSNENRSNQRESAVENMKKSALRYFLGELLGKILTQTEKDELLFDFLWSQSIDLLAAEKTNPDFHLNFMWQLSNVMGISPSLNTSGEFFDHEESCFAAVRPNHNNFEEGEIKVLLMKLIEGNSFSQAQRQSLIRFFLRYFEFQFGGGIGRLKSLSVLESVFS
jgi:DNA repair protein RecO (recombination protein O)